MKRLTCILAIIWLGILSGQLVYAANSCPQDSVIGYSEDGTPISKIIYGYDDAGRTILEEKWRMNEDSILVGNSKTTTAYYPNGKTKETASWMWSNENEDWIGQERNIYSYNEKGSIISWTIYSWDGINNCWINKTWYEYTYDENNRAISTVSYIGLDSSWVYKTKQEYEYDNKGHMILDRYFEDYNINNKTWIGSHWYISQYDNGNHEILSEKYSWDSSKNDWKGDSKFEYGYNSSGALTHYIYYSWNSSTSAFIASSKVYTDYDQWNNICYNERYQWINGNLVGIQKIRYEYTAYNSDPIMKTTFAWDSIHNVFIGVDSVRLAKDAAGNQILDEHYVWSNNNWSGDKKEEFIYDAAKNVISKITYSWITESATWMYATRDSSQYNENKLPILEEHYIWSTVGGGYWKGDGEKYVSEYTNNMETLKEVYIWKDEIKNWTYKSKIIKEFDATGTKLLLDEEYALNGEVLEGTKKEKYSYNIRGETVLTVKYSWLYDDVWQGKDSILADYDSNKQQTLNEKYTWATEGYWRGTEKATYTFNKNKQQTSSWVYNWDDSNRQWIFSTRDTASFDAAKNQILKESYTYDMSTSNWVGQEKWEAAYDAAKNQTMDAQYTWKDGAWVGTSKKEYGFNADKQQVMFATYEWRDGTWFGTNKEERELDDEGREILVAAYKWVGNTWVGKSRVVTTYVRDKLIASLANYDWTSNKWVGKDSTLYTYNAADLETSKIVMFYQSSAWVNSTKLEQTYNESNTLSAKYNFTWQSNAWQPIDKWEAHFDMVGRMDLDSTMVYQNNTWIYKNRNTNTYDSQDRLTLIMTENWVDGVPSTGSKTENEYGEYGLTHTITSEMQGGTWVPLTKKDNTYNTNGQLTETKDQENTALGWQTTHLYQATYDGDKQTLSMDQIFENGVVVSGERIVYEYTPSENIETTSNWEGGDWVEHTRIGYYKKDSLSIETHYIHDGTQWIGNTKVETVTIGNNKEIATYQWQTEWVGITKTGTYYDEYEDETNASWNWENDNWVCDTKKGESKDDNGKIKSQTTYKIVSNTFVFSSRVEYEYGTGDRDKTTATYTWDTSIGAWHGDSKSGVTYSGSNKTSETSYTWLSEFKWRPNQKKEYEYGSHPNDLTTAIYNWDTTIEDWVGFSKSGVTYASNGKQASEFSYTWGITASGKSDWLPVSMTEWEYGSGKDNSVATYKGVDTAWVGIRKTKETYDANGDTLAIYTYAFSMTEKVWKDSLKMELYSEQIDSIINTYRIYAQWNNTEWVKKNQSTKWESAYDKNDSLILDAHYKWSKAQNKWIGTDLKYVYSYDDFGNKIYYEIMQWSSSEWVGSNKYIMHYNKDNKIILNESWAYNSTKGKYRGASKVEYDYSCDSIQSMTASYMFNTEQWDWEGVTKNEDIYDENCNLLVSCTYQWSYSLWTWVGLYKYETKYDEKERIIEQTTSRFDTAWYYDSKTQFAYDDKHGQVERLEYAFCDTGLVLISHTKQEYDQDGEGKLRSDLNASWNSTGDVSRYEYTSYYYACDPKFQVEVKASPEEGGSVSGDGEFILNGQASLVATPEEGCYTFLKWVDTEGTTISTSPTCKFLVDKSETYTAVFEPVKHTIRASVSSAGGGSVRVAIKPE